MRDYKKNLSNELNNLLRKMRETMLSEIPVDKITTDYFLMFAFEQEDCMLYKTVNSFMNSIVINQIHDRLYARIEEREISAIRPGRDVSFTSEFEKYMSDSDIEREKMGDKFITSDHVLLAVMKDNSYSESKNILSSEGLSYRSLKDASMKLHNLTKQIANTHGHLPAMVIGPNGMFGINENAILTGVNDSVKKAGIQNCRNLNGLASLGKIDPLIGRSKEISLIERVLARRKCNNVILVGKSGCGKTTIVEGLAKMINDGTAPISLLGKTIYALKINELISGTGLRGAFEEKVSKLFASLKGQKDCILFIDDAHVITTNNKKDDFDMLSIISEYISDSDVRLILSTTVDGYRSFVNSNSDMSRRFNRIDVEPLSKEDTLSVLFGVSKLYSEFHNVIYSENILKTITDMADRYVTNVPLPTSAIDLMDDAGALRGIVMRSSLGIDKKMRMLSELRAEKDICIRKDDIDGSKTIENEINRLRCDITDLKSKTEFSDDERTVTENDVFSAISEKTGIPVGKLSTSERNQLLSLDSTLKNIIIGQDEAMESVANAIRRNKSGLRRKNKPIYVGFFAGGSGVGKTLTAKTLASEVFGDEKYLIRFDMSEYADKTSVNKLIGAGAGYIGYDKGGLLTEAVKNRKYAVLLFDEIEKADDEVYNILLQVMDEASLTDNRGNKVDFRNTMIIMTSNVGASKSYSEKPVGFIKDNAMKMNSIMESEMRKKFPPEFINRIDDVVFFNCLSDDDMDKIVRLELGKLNNILKSNGCSMEYTDDVVHYIIEKTSDEREYGARPVSRIIQNEIENVMAEKLIESDEKSHKFSITCDNDGTKLSIC